MKNPIKMLILLFLTTVGLNACKKNSSADTVAPAAPVVTNVQPKNPLPGDVVTITGTSFGTVATDVKVMIGTQAITITSVTDTEIKFTMPTGITAGDIAVAIRNITATNTDPQKATITPQTPAAAVATIISINPTSGKAGDIVSILGTGFSTIASDNVVKFNGVTATVTGSVTSVLTVTVPQGVTTGAVTVSVKGAAAVTGPTFTVAASTGGGTGTAVPYITSVSGSATFSKIATAPSEIGAMVIDKKNNVLYYADYSIFAASHTGTVYKLKLDGSAPTVLTTDNRINTVYNLGVDATGNVIVFTGADNLGINVNVFKIDASSNAVTSIASKVNLGGGTGLGITVDSQGAIWLGYGLKLNTTTNSFDRISAFPYTAFSSTQYQGDDIYIDNASTSNVAYVKYNLLTKTATPTDFTLQTLFKQDNASFGSNSSVDVQTRYALDNSENFYAMYPYTGDATSGTNDYYVIRKTKNGSAGASTLITKFYTKPFSVASPVTYQQPRLNTGLLFQADATGNLYFKDNGTDIIKVTP